MWKTIVLHHLLRITINSEESWNEAIKFFDCFPRLKKEGSCEQQGIAHYYGQLFRQGDCWRIKKCVVNRETLGFGTIKDISAPVHVFTSVPTMGIESDEMPKTLLVVPDEIYQMTGALDSIEGKYQAIYEFLSLREDQKATVYRLMTNDVFAKNMARCLGFMASEKLSPYRSSERNENLIERYNDTYGNGCKRVDMYRIFTLLDLIGDQTLLSENSPAIHCPPNYLSFLAIYALSEGCSVWSTPGKSITYLLLNGVPLSLPMYMLCWILDSAQMNDILKALLKSKSKKKRSEIRIMLIRLLQFGTGLNLQVVQNSLRHLMQRGLDDAELETLLSGNSATVVKSFLQLEYGLTL